MSNLFIRTTIRRHKIPRPAFSLLEVVAATLVVGIIAVSAGKTFTSVARGGLNQAQRAQASALADSMLTEIVGHPYFDPGGASAIGVDTGESHATRSTLDDVDDYHALSESPPSERTGMPLNGFSGWRRDVSVSWADAANLDQTSASDTGIKRITVTVSKDSTVILSRSTLRTNTDDL